MASTTFNFAVNTMTSTGPQGPDGGDGGDVISTGPDGEDGGNGTSTVPPESDGGDGSDGTSTGELILGWVWREKVAVALIPLLEFLATLSCALHEHS